VAPTEENEVDLLAMIKRRDAEVERSNRLIAEMERWRSEQRAKSVPQSVLRSLTDDEGLLAVLLGLSSDQLIVSLLYLAYDPPFRQKHNWVFEKFIRDRSFSTEVRSAAVTCLGIRFQNTVNPDVCVLLRRGLFDESEPDVIRERFYFALLLVSNVAPFPVDTLGNWNAQFDGFRFPRDANWSLIRAEGEYAAKSRTDVQAAKRR